MNRFLTISIVALLALALPLTIMALPTANGTWDVYPGQATTYAVAPLEPINADGTSNFKSNGNAVIPIKFQLASGLGPFVFESILSDTIAENDYSYASFTPSSPVTFNDITALSAVYAFTLGDCHGGSLRWSIRTSDTQVLFIYFGNPLEFGNGGVGGCTPTSPGGIDQSGANLIGLTDLRYDTSQYPGGTFYDSYAHTQQLLGTTPIIRASLVLDSGWGGDQRLTLTSATFATAAFSDTFVPQPSTPAATCPTEQATIQVTKTEGGETGDVNEPMSIQSQDDNGIFRIVDCKYMYNLATSSLSGVGSYEVQVVINGTTADGTAVFALR